jgi:hypothetical protein
MIFKPTFTSLTSTRRRKGGGRRRLAKGEGEAGSPRDDGAQRAEGTGEWARGTGEAEGRGGGANLSGLPAADTGNRPPSPGPAALGIRGAAPSARPPYHRRVVRGDNTSQVRPRRGSGAIVSCRQFAKAHPQAPATPGSFNPTWHSRSGPILWMMP